MKTSRKGMKRAKTLLGMALSSYNEGSEDQAGEYALLAFSELSGEAHADLESLVEAIEPEDMPHDGKTSDGHHVATDASDIPNEFPEMEEASDTVQSALAKTIKGLNDAGMEVTIASAPNGGFTLTVAEEVDVESSEHSGHPKDLNSDDDEDPHGSSPDFHKPNAQLRAALNAQAILMASTGRPNKAKKLQAAAQALV